MGLVWLWSAGFAHILMVPSGPEPPASAAATIAFRFPADWIAPASKSAFVGTRSPREASPTNPLDWLSSALLFEQAHQDLASGPFLETAISPLERSNRASVDGMPDPRATSRIATVLNEAQVASIRDRLKLTAEQQSLWTPVEAALREVAWRGSRDKLDSKTATLDPRGIESLKNALIPFLKTLSTEQKDELRMIAHLMGLERLASQL